MKFVGSCEKKWPCWLVAFLKHNILLEIQIIGSVFDVFTTSLGDSRLDQKLTWKLLRFD